MSEDVILPWQVLTVQEHYLSTQAIYLTRDFSTAAVKERLRHTFSFGNVMKFTYPRSNYIIHMYSQNIKWHI